MRKLFSLIALLFFIAPAASHAQMSSATLLALINNERAQGGLAAVAENAKLAQAAQLKAEDMVSRGYFEHVGPDGKGPSSWYLQVGYDWSWGGEILALNSNTSSEAAIVESWMNSPSHRAVIMDSRHTEVGFGIALGIYEGHRVVYVAGEFGVPKQPLPSVVQIAGMSPSQVETSKEIQAATESVVKTVAQTFTKPVEAVVKKAEAEEVAPAITASVEVTSVPAMAETPKEAPKATWFIRLKNWLIYWLF